MLIKGMAPIKKSPKNKIIIPARKAPELTPDADDKLKMPFNWFPGHMMKALRDIKARVGMVDLVMEIRDARIPLVSGNAFLNETIAGKSRLILINKANLSDPEVNIKWEAWFEANGIPYLFLNALDRHSLKPALSYAKKIIEDKRKSCNGTDLADKEKYKFMIIGLPNTGKSTFINAVAQRNAAKVANKPGQTQIQQWVKIDEEMDLLDTPGVMPPQIENDEHKMWLSIINAIPDHVVGEEDPACYLVNYLLKKKVPEFGERYKLESLEISLVEALDKIAKVRGCLKQKGLPDYDRVYKLVLADFREGLLGRVSLGNPPLK